VIAKTDRTSQISHRYTMISNAEKERKDRIYSALTNQYIRNDGTTTRSERSTLELIKFITSHRVKEKL